MARTISHLSYAIFSFLDSVVHPALVSSLQSALRGAHRRHFQLHFMNIAQSVAAGDGVH
jgi:hypothetical protein